MDTDVLVEMIYPHARCRCYLAFKMIYPIPRRGCHLTVFIYFSGMKERPRVALSVERASVDRLLRTYTTTSCVMRHATRFPRALKMMKLRHLPSLAQINHSPSRIKEAGQLARLSNGYSKLFHLFIYGLCKVHVRR